VYLFIKKVQKNKKIDIWIMINKKTIVTEVLFSRY